MLGVFPRYSKAAYYPHTENSAGILELMCSSIKVGLMIRQPVGILDELASQLFGILCWQLDVLILVFYTLYGTISHIKYTLNLIHCTIYIIKKFGSLLVKFIAFVGRCYFHSQLSIVYAVSKPCGKVAHMYVI